MRPTTASPQAQSSPASSSSDIEGWTATTDRAALLRAVLRAWVAGLVGTAQLRGALRLFCDDARKRELRPEEMLVEFKAVCASVPEVFAQRLASERDEIVRRAVTLCIDEFYAEPSRLRPGADDVAAT